MAVTLRREFSNSQKLRASARNTWVSSGKFTQTDQMKGGVAPRLFTKELELGPFPSFFTVDPEIVPDLQQGSPHAD